MNGNEDLALDFYQDECDNLRVDLIELRDKVYDLEIRLEESEAELEAAHRTIQDLATEYGHNFI